MMLKEELPMVTFLKRPKVIKAEQFLIDKPFPKGVKQGTAGDIYQNEPFYTYQEHSKSKKVLINPTDWILHLISGERAIISDEEFNQEYEIRED